MREFEPLPPACMKCEAVTGKATCFPAPCVFYHQRDTPGTKAHSVATLDRIRRGSREPVYAQAIEAGTAETAGLGPKDESAVPQECAQSEPSS